MIRLILGATIGAAAMYVAYPWLSQWMPFRAPTTAIRRTLPPIRINANRVGGVPQFQNQKHIFVD